MAPTTPPFADGRHCYTRHIRSLDDVGNEGCTEKARFRTTGWISSTPDRDGTLSCVRSDQGEWNVARARARFLCCILWKTNKRWSPATVLHSKGYNSIQVSNRVIVDSHGFELKINCCWYSSNISMAMAQGHIKATTFTKGRLCYFQLIDGLVTWYEVSLKAFQCQQISSIVARRRSRAVIAIKRHCLFASISTAT